MRRLEVIVVSGASPSSIAITFEMLAVANALSKTLGRANAFDVSASGAGAAGLRSWLSDIRLAEPGDKPDVVVVPGLAFMTEAAIAEGLRRSDVVAAAKRVSEVHLRGAALAASCSGVFLLAQAGVLAKRRVTTSWWLAPIFKRSYPDVALDTDSMVVTDRDVTTAGAAMAQLDLMLALIAKFAGSEVAERCANYMLIDKRSSQSRFMAVSYLAAADDRIARAERWARARIGKQFDIDEMAKAAGMSARTFARRLDRVTGLSPVQFVQRLRVERAMAFLETTRLPFGEIARRVGYAEPSTLRRLLKREEATGAREIRAKRDRQARAQAAAE